MGNKIVEVLSDITKSKLQVTPDILLLQFTVVNACIVSNISNDPNKWVLVDTGLENSADFILECANEMFGKESKPEGIILTHGHFDHVGSVKELAEYWQVPVYIHPLEMPYVTGEKDYPVPDSSVDEGLVAKMSPSFPHKSINLGNSVIALPSDGSIPIMPDWLYIHTPGHCEGHISLYKKDEGIIIVADAFCTLKQESLISVLTQKENISGPPKYLTIDWDKAKESIIKLSNLEPRLAITSHGEPMAGENLRNHLDYLINNFNEIAVPEDGKFL
ncbi:MAG: beta-lactamase domain protein [Bacillales bacterium]|jgi:glyoxylase-like metal-dependent hydrolase (beta-lactamase superfamily II)|nr:beta-lactamase domain protein [Bacillales bacterium]